MMKKGQHEPSTLQKEAKTRSVQGIPAYAGGTGSVIAPQRSGASTPTDRIPRNEDLLETRMRNVSHSSTIYYASTSQGTDPHGVGTHRSPYTIPSAQGDGAHRPHDMESALPGVGRSPHHACCLALSRFARSPDHAHTGHITPAQEQDHPLQQEGPMSEAGRTNAPPYSPHHPPSSSKSGAPTRCPRSGKAGHRTDSIASARTHTQKNAHPTHTQEGKHDRSHTLESRKGGHPTAHDPRRARPTDLHRYPSQHIPQPRASRSCRSHLLCPSTQIPFLDTMPDEDISNPLPVRSSIPEHRHRTHRSPTDFALPTPRPTPETTGASPSANLHPSKRTCNRSGGQDFQVGVTVYFGCIGRY